MYYSRDIILEHKFVLKTNLLKQEIFFQVILLEDTTRTFFNFRKISCLCKLFDSSLLLLLYSHYRICFINNFL